MGDAVPTFCRNLPCEFAGCFAHLHSAWLRLALLFSKPEQFCFDSSERFGLEVWTLVEAILAWPKTKGIIEKIN